MNINKQKLSIEEGLLKQAGYRGSEIDELISQRYSMGGTQKPILVLTPNEGQTGVAEVWKAPQEIVKTPRTKKQRLLNDHKPRVALSQFLKDAKTHQKTIKGVMERIYRSKSCDTTVTKKEMESWRQLPKYSTYTRLNKLWNGYITDLLMVKEGDDDINSAKKMNYAQKLTSADFNGAKITVIEARNPSIVGLTGIVAWEAKSNFVIVCEGGKCFEKMDSLEGMELDNPGKDTQVGGLKIVDKSGTRFIVHVDVGEMEFEIIGSRFLFRTADRSGKKFKPKNVDLLISYAT
ncbi:YALI0C03784p [Yarrowia lipolytica CLIB122]|uniref:Ribonuclease P protein subunit n=1 Tax=Yarrowia lipolytica (strain CLIB 122 / E 150) TaxID=284591 RepID=Q6CD49_YARLI|nr:YALI0C03784p [Yarrowia lipolytica CLIB122]KAJ8053029.1 Rof/RNase P-like protein [Yarrowia lipolytica]CAG81712.1 YALI0C03784p [Yarrowia lipolytica CLIB122]|eukprot:XP_501413.1 YALI0C03784p [Yarrowia lipolytica CLIB122]